MSPPRPLRLRGRWPFAAALVLLAGLAPGRAPAQFAVGVGPYGVGFHFGFQPSPSTTYLNQRALIGQQNAMTNRPTPLRAPQPGGPRGYDPAFFQRYGVETRRAIEDQVARRPARRPVAAAAAPAQPAPVRAVATLASFFNEYEELVWPADAPRDPDLLPRRDTADAASLAVYRDQKSRGVAALGLVTDARQKLLAYGRPALQRMRERTTTQLSDAFHAFLLSLYDALQAAAMPTAGTPGR